MFATLKSLKPQNYSAAFFILFSILIQLWLPAKAQERINPNPLPDGGSGGLTIVPTRVDLTATRPIRSFTIVNRGESDTLINARPVLWSQDARGNSQHKLTRDLIVNPPIKLLKAGQQQEFRVGMRRAPDSNIELSYRIHVGETPNDNFEESGPKMVVGFWLPVFIKPTSGSIEHDVKWTVQPIRNSSNYDVLLIGENRGTKHFRSVGLVSIVDGYHTAASSGVAYILPKQRKEFLLKHRPAPTTPTEKYSKTPNQVLVLKETNNHYLDSIDE